MFLTSRMPVSHLQPAPSAPRMGPLDAFAHEAAANAPSLQHVQHSEMDHYRVGGCCSYPSAPQSSTAMRSLHTAPAMHRHPQDDHSLHTLGDIAASAAESAARSAAYPVDRDDFAPRAREGFPGLYTRLQRDSHIHMPNHQDQDHSRHSHAYPRVPPIHRRYAPYQAPPLRHCHVPSPYAAFRGPHGSQSPPIASHGHRVGVAHSHIDVLPLRHPHASTLPPPPAPAPGHVPFSAARRPGSPPELSTITTTGPSSDAAPIAEELSLVGQLCAKRNCYRQACPLYGDFCEFHKPSRLCKVPECRKCAKTGGYCIAHGGGRRCQHDGCTKSAKDGGLCISHGGGKRCHTPGCDRVASGSAGGHCSVHSSQKGESDPDA